MALDFPANPAVDDEYQGFKWDGNSWVPIAAASGGGVPEAPIDTKTYGRKDAAWAEITGGATGDFLPLTGGTLTGALKIETGKYLTLDKPLITNWAGMWFTTGAVAKWEWDLTDNNDNMVLRRFDAGGIPKLVQQVTQNNGVSTFFGPINIRGIDGANPTLSFNDEFAGADIWNVRALGQNQSLYFTAAGTGAKDFFILDKVNNRIDCMAPLFVNNTPVVMLAQHQAALDLIAKLEARLDALEAKSKKGSK